MPQRALVVLIGASGSGKSTFAARHFRPTEIVSSDACRAMVGDDEAEMGATDAAFEVLHLIAWKRLEAGRLTVVDATNVQPESRAPLIRLAHQHHRPAVAVVFDMPNAVSVERHRSRVGRPFGAHVVRNQAAQLRRSLAGLDAEGFDRVYVLTSPAEIDAAEVVREPLRPSG